MAVANTLAYYDTATFKAIEVFREQAPECIMLHLPIQNVAPLNVIRQNVVMPNGITLNVVMSLYIVSRWPLLNVIFSFLVKTTTSKQ
jgi:hypothetical protein